jgi:hypothetical protein
LSLQNTARWNQKGLYAKLPGQSIKSLFQGGFMALIDLRGVWPSMSLRRG